MDLLKHYDTLYHNAVQNILNDQYQVDTNIDAKEDRRMGITLLLRPPASIKTKIQDFLTALQKVEPLQYYYPSTDIHITVMSIISCYEGFQLHSIDSDAYITLIKQCLTPNLNVEIQFKGITASDSCIMVPGFMNNDHLKQFRDRLRAVFKNSTLEQSLDKRYAIQTAHATVVRFRKKLYEKGAFLAILERYRNVDFGTFQVNKLELVHNDWYQRKKKVQKLHEFRL